MATLRPLRLVRRVGASQQIVLDPSQAEVLASRGKRLLVTGGPGSGKTTTLIESAAARIAGGQSPESILVLAYGRERASQIRDQIALSASATTFEPIARTFHSLAFSIINDGSAADARPYLLISGAEQDLFIRELLATDITGQTISWPENIKLALPTRGFAKEIRDLILRATERGYTPQSLKAKGLELGEPYWSAVADFWMDYQRALISQSVFVAGAPYRIDPSEVITEAIVKLRQDNELLTKYRKKFSTILVDEFQESDKAQRTLLQLIAPQDLMIFADSHSTVGRFRGADPEGVLAFAQSLDCENLVVKNNHRNTIPIAQLSKFIIGQSATGLEEIVQSEVSGLQAITLNNQNECANLIAHAFRSAHLREGIPWSEMAVIVRSPGGQVAALQRAFAVNSIPLNVDSDALALADNPSIRPFLLVAQIAAGMISLNSSHWPEIQELLLSEIGGADALTLRQIRTRFAKERALQFEKLNKDNQSEEVLEIASVTDLIIDAIRTPILDPERRNLPLYRLGTLIAQAKKAYKQNNSISDLLWAVWCNAENHEGKLIAAEWRGRALSGGSRGAAADRDLDAMMELFESARRFMERMPGSTAKQFIGQLLGEKILGDTITAKGQRENVVSLLTVHSAKGQQWEIVALAGLQEGVWPNLRQRGSLLGSERLVEADRSQVSAAAELLASTAYALAKDERRLLYVALSRAKSRLLVTAYRSEDSEPSSYFDEISTFIYGEEAAGDPTFAMPRALNQQSLVAELRRNLHQVLAEDSENPHQEFAAGLLKTIALAGVRSADPDQWLGTSEISSENPVVEPGQDIFISPSNLQSFSECGVKWFLERSGGRDLESTAQILGSAIHALAAQVSENPDLSLDDLQRKLEAAWTLVDAGVGWVNKLEFQKASEMLRKFFEWHARDAASRTLKGTESEFNVRMGNVVLLGSVDRLELLASGELFIIDLKTGRSSSVSREDALEHKQLMGYQLAILEGGFQGVDESVFSGGAELVFLGGPARNAEIRTQFPLDHAEIKSQVLDIATNMSSNSFTATINKRCTSCEVKSSCPIQPHGRSVIEK